MAETLSFDLLVIGGGPAGYVGAIRAAHLGMKVAVVERDRLGGTCLNWGCIPTKALIANAELYHKLAHEAAAWGIMADNVRHDWAKVISRSRDVAGKLNRGIGALFKKHKIPSFEGTAKITQAPVPFKPGAAAKPGVVEVRDAKGELTHTISAVRILIATGASPRPLPMAPFDGDKVISSKEAMTITTQPKTLLIIGAGAIGMEFAYIYNAFGTKVTVIEMLDRLLPNEDEEASALVGKAFRKQGIETLTGHKTLAVKKTAEGVELTVAPTSNEKETSVLKGDKVLVAVGVKGNIAGLWDEKIAIETFKDHVKIKDRKGYETSVGGIYAIGDVNGPPWLAHVAMEEAVNCVEEIAGVHSHAIDYDAIPGCTYCIPQVASMGFTEQALKAKGLKAGVDYSVGKFPFAGSGKAQALSVERVVEGFVKLISDKKTGEILGVHMVGDGVTELLAEMGLAKRLEATVEEVIATMHAHPTLSEAVHEAALGTDGRMLHF
jgi:dihydrolipoamide dehydrogenase